MIYSNLQNFYSKCASSYNLIKTNSSTFYDIIDSLISNNCIKIIGNDRWVTNNTKLIVLVRHNDILFATKDDTILSKFIESDRYLHSTKIPKLTNIIITEKSNIH